MNNFDLEIIETQNDIIYEVPKVEFPAYEEYKEKAEAVAEYIRSMEVTEETVKETKQTLAKARKLTDRISRIRIDMKKELLKNYTAFESQVKEIVRIVDDADLELRTKVRELEENERKQKEGQIRELWIKRIEPYPLILTIMPDAFDRWISPKHLNKTMSMNAVEKDMTAWIEKTYNDMNTALSMGAEYAAAYGWQGDLAKAIEVVNAQKETVKNIEGAEEEEEAKETFIVYGKKDIELTKMLLNDHDINYVIF